MRKTRAHYTAKKIFPLLDKLEQSNLTQERFCKEHDVTERIINYWRPRWRQSKAANPIDNTKGTFIKVKPSIQTSSSKIKIKYYEADIFIDSKDEIQLTTLLKAIKNVS